MSDDHHQRMIDHALRSMKERADYPAQCLNVLFFSSMHAGRALDDAREEARHIVDVDRRKSAEAEIERVCGLVLATFEQRARTLLRPRKKPIEPLLSDEERAAITAETEALWARIRAREAEEARQAEKAP